MEENRREIFKQLAIGVAGSIITLLLVAIWGWISAGEVVRILGGVNQPQLAAAIAEMETTLEGRLAGLDGVSQEQLAEARAAIEATLEGRLAEKSEVAELLANTVILTDQECKVFGPNWKRYEAMDGRFPIGAGEAEDSRNESRTFTVGQADGAYQHQLTVAEMPSHTHRYQDRFFNINTGGNDRGDEDDTERTYVVEGRETGPTGNNQPHNNMPPYLVMNFCHLVPSGP